MDNDKNLEIRFAKNSWDELLDLLSRVCNNLEPYKTDARYDYQSSLTEISLRFNELTENTTISESLKLIRRSAFFKPQISSFGIQFDGRTGTDRHRIRFPIDLVNQISAFKARKAAETFNSPYPTSYSKEVYTPKYLDELLKNSARQQPICTLQ